MKLWRVARVTKLIWAWPELLVLLKGLVLAMRAVMTTLALVVIVIYIFAIVFRQLTRGTRLEADVFKSMPAAMSMLLLSGTVPDHVDVIIQDLGPGGLPVAIIYYIFLLVVSFTVLNLLVGVLVNVVAVVTSVEQEVQQVAHFRQNLTKMIPMLDEDGNQHISKEEFEAVLINPEVCAALQAVGVDPVGLVDFTDFLFEEDALPVPVAKFLDLILQLRGSNSATIKDLVSMRRLLVLEMQRMEVRLTRRLTGVRVPAPRLQRVPTAQTFCE